MDLDLALDCMKLKAAMRKNYMMCTQSGNCTAWMIRYETHIHYTGTSYVWSLGTMQVRVLGTMSPPGWLRASRRAARNINWHHTQQMSGAICLQAHRAVCEDVAFRKDLFSGKIWGFPTLCLRISGRCRHIMFPGTVWSQEQFEHRTIWWFQDSMMIPGPFWTHHISRFVSRNLISGT